MGYLRATKSVDGKLRANVNLRFRVDVGHLQAALVNCVDAEQPDTPEEVDISLTGITRAQVEKQLRGDLFTNGVTCYDFFQERTYMDAIKLDEQPERGLYESARTLFDYCHDEAEHVVLTLFPTFEVQA